MEGSKNNLDIQCSLKNGMQDIAKMFAIYQQYFQKMEVLIC